jgi:hypothetical protein
MFESYERCSSGIMYIKNNESLLGFLEEILNFIQNSNSFLSEMIVLNNYYRKNKEHIQLLPTYWYDETMEKDTYLNYSYYNDTIFDAASMGCYLLGLDPYHTNGIIVKNIKSPFAYIDCTKNKFDWIEDEKGRKRPFIWNGEKWLLINNLHVHAKNLTEGLSRPIIN